MAEIENYQQYDVRFRCPECGSTRLVEEYRTACYYEITSHDGYDAETEPLDILNDMDILDSNGFGCKNCGIPIHLYNDWKRAEKEANEEGDCRQPIFFWLKNRGMLVPKTE